MWRCARHFVLPYGVRRPLPCVALGVLSIYLPHSLPIGFTKLSGEPGDRSEVSRAVQAREPQEPFLVTRHRLALVLVLVSVHAPSPPCRRCCHLPHLHARSCYTLRSVRAISRPNGRRGADGPHSQASPGALCKADAAGGGH